MGLGKLCLGERETAHGRKCNPTPFITSRPDRGGGPDGSSKGQTGGLDKIGIAHTDDVQNQPSLIYAPHAGGLLRAS